MVKLFKDNALDGPRGNCGVSPQFMMYRRAYPESKMLKSKRGEAAYWLVGAAGGAGHMAVRRVGHQLKPAKSVWAPDRVEQASSHCRKDEGLPDGRSAAGMPFQ